ncbi:hypothetical protein [Dactylosporangium sp. NPDC049140]|uniref:hypothetical protein n=1 Tax=Dactylosporangium sp. NPDC049140 TaxID=3155647 RepID=UPI0033F90E33
MPEVTVLVENGDRPAVHREAIAELCADLRDLGIEVAVEEDAATSRAVTWYEVTMIYLGGKILDGVTGGLIDSGVSAVRDRVAAWAKRRQERDPQQRPQVVELYGPDGKLIKTVRVKSGEITED